MPNKKEAQREIMTYVINCNGKKVSKAGNKESAEAVAKMCNDYVSKTFGPNAHKYEVEEVEEVETIVEENKEAEEAVANYNAINAVVIEVLYKTFNNKNLTKTIKNAIETLEANQIVIDGVVKEACDKKYALRDLKKALLEYESFKQHINYVISFLEVPAIAEDFYREK